MYDVNGTETTSYSEASTHVYHISANKLINGVSTTKVVVSKSTNA